MTVSGGLAPRDGIEASAGEMPVVSVAGERLYRDWSDGELMVAVAKECGDAYAELYRRHSGSVAAVARMILRSDPLCDDVVAEVFVALWFSPKLFDPTRASLLGFLRMKARGRSIDLLRAETTRKRREVNEGAVPVAMPEIESGLLAAETCEALRRAVNALPSEEREVIRLAFFGGMTYRAAAAHLGVPEGTVKSRIRSGLGRLRVSDLLRPGAEQDVASTDPAVFARIIAAYSGSERG